MLPLHSGDKTASPRLNPGAAAILQPKASWFSAGAAVRGWENKRPGRGERADRNVDQGRAVAPGKGPPEGCAKLLRVAGALGCGAEALRELDEIGVGEV